MPIFPRYFLVIDIIYFLFYFLKEEDTGTCEVPLCEKDNAVSPPFCTESTHWGPTLLTEGTIVLAEQLLYFYSEVSG